MAYLEKAAPPPDKACTFCYTMNTFDRPICDFCGGPFPAYDPSQLVQYLPVECQTLFAMIKKETNPVSYRACIKTLCGLVTTIVNNADKESTRRINVANKTWQATCGQAVFLTSLVLSKTVAELNPKTNPPMVGIAGDRDADGKQKYHKVLWVTEPPLSTHGLTFARVDDTTYGLVELSDGTKFENPALIPACTHFMKQLDFKFERRKPPLDPKKPSSKAPKISVFMVLRKSVTEAQARSTTSKLGNALACLTYEIHCFYPRFKRRKGIRNMLKWPEDALESRSLNFVTKLNEAYSSYGCVKGDLKFESGAHLLDVSDLLFNFSTMIMLPQLVNWKCIKELDARNNKLMDLNGILDLKELTYLNCAGNFLRDDDFEGKTIPNFPKLRFFDVSRNRLTAMPNFSQIPKLEFCNLSRNKITSLKSISHPGIMECLKIQMLDLSYNVIVISNPAVMEFCLTPWDRLSIIDFRVAGNEFLFDVEDYRVWILQFMTGIKVLDGKEVSSVERKSTPAGNAWMKYTPDMDPLEERKQAEGAKDTMEDMLNNAQLAIEAKVLEAKKKELLDHLSEDTDALPAGWEQVESDADPTDGNLVMGAGKPCCYNPKTGEVVFSRVNLRRRVTMGFQEYMKVGNDPQGRSGWHGKVTDFEEGAGHDAYGPGISVFQRFGSCSAGEEETE